MELASSSLLPAILGEERRVFLDSHHLEFNVSSQPRCDLIPYEDRKGFHCRDLFAELEFGHFVVDVTVVEPVFDLLIDYAV